MASRIRTQRVTHVTCATSSGFRWLIRNLGQSAVKTADGFMVLDETRWGRLLVDAEGVES
jgi:hypothetical protein